MTEEEAANSSKQQKLREKSSENFQEYSRVGENSSSFSSSSIGGSSWDQRPSHSDSDFTPVIPRINLPCDQDNKSEQKQQFRKSCPSFGSLLTELESPFTAFANSNFVPYIPPLTSGQVSANGESLAGSISRSTPLINECDSSKLISRGSLMDFIPGNLSLKVPLNFSPSPSPSPSQSPSPTPLTSPSSSSHLSASLPVAPLLPPPRRRRVYSQVVFNQRLVPSS